MTKKNWFLPSLIILGLVCIGLSLLITGESSNLVFGQKSLAKAQHGLGKVLVIRKGLTKKETLTGRTSLYEFDSLETSADGDATLETSTGYKIRIPENSYVTLSNESGKTIIQIKLGEIQFEVSGQTGTLLVAREGARLTPSEYETAIKNEVPLEKLPDLSPSVVGNNDVQTSEGLTPEQIQDTLRNNRSAFFRCYTQLLQKTPGITGQSSMSFTIEPSGKVGLASIASSSIEDAQFQRCLLDTLKRISFKSFTGKTLSTIFPLKFE